MAGQHGLVPGIFTALAEYDCESTRERAAAGIILAKARGRLLGRWPGGGCRKSGKVKACLAAGMPVHQPITATGASESSIKRCRRQLGLE